MTAGIKLPKYEIVVEKHVYSQEQYDIVYEFAKIWENGLSLMLLLETGISRSELLGNSDLKMLTRFYDHASEETRRNVLLTA